VEINFAIAKRKFSNLVYFKNPVANQVPGLGVILELLVRDRELDGEADVATVARIRRRIVESATAWKKPKISVNHSF
jgi:hypothetical protein